MHEQRDRLFPTDNTVYLVRLYEQILANHVIVICIANSGKYVWALIEVWVGVRVFSGTHFQPNSNETKPKMQMNKVTTWAMCSIIGHHRMSFKLGQCELFFNQFDSVHSKKLTRFLLGNWIARSVIFIGRWSLPRKQFPSEFASQRQLREISCSTTGEEKTPS